MFSSALSFSSPTRLPARYREAWGTEFWGYVNAALRPGAVVLDVGRRPTISNALRPAGTHYAGLDISGSELDAAPAGSYDETVVSPAQIPVPSLVGRFDLVVAWQVLEHVRDLDRAAEAFRSYSREGGWFVACLSGRHAAYAIVNRVLPASAGKHLVARVRRRPPETVFPAYYDHCDERGLREAFAGWEELHVVPLWHGADYFMRLPGLLQLYLAYEDWAIRRGLTNLATHYVVAARRA